MVNVMPVWGRQTRGVNPTLQDPKQDLSWIYCKSSTSILSRPAVMSSKHFGWIHYLLARFSRACFDRQAYQAALELKRTRPVASRVAFAAPRSSTCRYGSYGLRVGPLGPSHIKPFPPVALTRLTHLNSS